MNQLARFAYVLWSDTLFWTALMVAASLYALKTLKKLSVAFLTLGRYPGPSVDDSFICERCKNRFPKQPGPTQPPPPGFENAVEVCPACALLIITGADKMIKNYTELDLKQAFVAGGQMALKSLVHRTTIPDEDIPIMIERDWAKYIKDHKRG